MLMYGSSFMAVTRKPCPRNSAPIEDVATPFPNELHTPPETTMYLTPFSTWGRNAALAGDGGGTTCLDPSSNSSAGAGEGGGK
mmetsp:Transcript_36442/g.78685  ORF Transcript_36442/g.78685 Transcript_36442/m.78685 type:complete len:83 (-) Transcript_36442:162-410(-)